MGSDHSKIVRARGDRDALKALIRDLRYMSCCNAAMLSSCLLEVGVVVANHGVSAKTLRDTIAAGHKTTELAAFGVFATCGACRQYLTDDGRWVTEGDRDGIAAVYSAAIKSPCAAELLEAFARHRPSFDVHHILGFNYLAAAHAAGLDHAAIAYAYASMVAPADLFARVPRTGATAVVDRAATCDCLYCTAIAGSYHAAYDGIWWNGPPLLASEKAAVADAAREVASRFGCSQHYAELYAHRIALYAARRRTFAAPAIPTAIVPTAIAPTAIAPTAIVPTAIAPTAIAPTAIAPTAEPPPYDQAETK